ncbi:hypothetical protein [Sinanaerobacter chloroacetimidivorans]|nr:hypothetical protein [Sinanaerobacter chloroacetimidivorans]
MSDKVLKVAEITPEHIDSINRCQSGITTQNGKEVILIAYEKR